MIHEFRLTRAEIMKMAYDPGESVAAFKDAAFKHGATGFEMLTDPNTGDIVMLVEGPDQLFPLPAAQAQLPEAA